MTATESERIQQVADATTAVIQEQGWFPLKVLVLASIVQENGEREVLIALGSDMKAVNTLGLFLYATVIEDAWHRCGGGSVSEPWLPVRFSAPLTGAEDFTTHEDWLLRLVDIVWRLPFRGTRGGRRVAAMAAAPHPRDVPAGPRAHR